MAEVEISGDTLTVKVTGADKVLALKSHLEIPLAHVHGAEPGAEAAGAWWKGVKVAGARIPHLVKAGTFYEHGEKVFWDVHDPDKTVAILLDHETYSRLVVGVPDPAATIALVGNAVKGDG